MAVQLTTDDLIVWYYDERNVTGGYVLLESDDSATIQRVQDALIGAGVRCRKQGACFRPANNNKKYKTFIRVVKPSGDSPALAEIRGAIRALPNAHYDANPVEIRAYINGLFERINHQDEEIKSLQHILEESRNEQRRLIQQDATETYRAMEVMYEQELRERDNRIGRLQAGLDMALAKRDEMISQYIDLRDEAQKAQYSGQEVPSERFDECDEFSQVIGILLPNLEFMGNSIPFMRTEVRDYKYILEYLYQLNNHQQVQFKAFRGAEGWMEIDKKIREGQSHTARIYYKKHDQTSRYLVLVSEKAEQEFDKERLRKYSKSVDQKSHTNIRTGLMIDTHERKPGKRYQNPVPEEPTKVIADNRRCQHCGALPIPGDNICYTCLSR